MIDAIATLNESGKKWAIALVNRHPEKEVACTVKMKDALLEGNYEGIILAGDSPDSHNNINNPDRVVPVKRIMSFKKGMVNLPPHSLVILKLLLN